MKLITANLLMDRLMRNPIMKGLKIGEVASYMRDFASINGVAPILGMRMGFTEVVGRQGYLKEDCMRVENVYLCRDGLQLDPTYFDNNNKLSASVADSLLLPGDKTFYGAYTIQDDVITIDKDDAVLAIQYMALRIDEAGFPVLPYHGSLMMAITNFVKWQYFTILADSEMISDRKVTKAESEYTWYTGQYQMSEDIPTPDEAVSWANSWQTLLNNRSMDGEADHQPKIYKW